MKYTVFYEKEALKQLEKLNKETSDRIIAWINKNLEGCDDPRRIGKPLKGNQAGTWRYRIGDHRVLAKIEEKKLIIVVVGTGHRKKIYKKTS